MTTRSNSATSAAPRTSNRSKTQVREAVFTMLKEDHKRVKKLFRDFEKLNTKKDAEQRQMLVQQACTELEIHAQLEEEIFYPAAQENLKEKDLVEEAEVEHKSLKMLIADLKQLSPDDEKFNATFTVLSEYVKHHVREEEGEMFTQLERARVDWQAIHEAMQTRREELMQEFGMAQEQPSEEQATGTNGSKANGARKSSASNKSMTKTTATKRANYSANDAMNAGM